jgi:c-di-GMP-binding flagellar brake protein YcgR
MGEERRGFSRVPVPFDVRYRIYGELGESWRAMTTLNISAGGMRFRSGDLIEIGSHLEVQIALPSAAVPLVVQARVAWSQLLGSGVSENGAQFTNLTPEQREQIDGLVRFLMKTSPLPPPAT